MWIRDDAFIRGEIPMTKFAVRAVTMALLDIKPGDILLDIGAGTGSISIQAALLGADVYAIEQAREGVDLIQRNAEKFGVDIHIIHGSAPECLDVIPEFTTCFIGGSKGKLRQIVETVHAVLRPGGKLVANFIKLENMTIFTRLLHQYTYTQIESRLLQAAEIDHLGLLRGQNPVCLVGGIKP